jgi:U4/U6.U5 tri-snRNP-associated protein 1
MNFVTVVQSLTICIYINYCCYLIAETRKPEAEDVLMDEDDDGMPSGTVAKDDTNRLGVIKEETVIEDPKKDAEEEEEVIPDEVVHEAAVGKGLAGALKFLQERGTLNEGTNWGGRTTDKKKSKLVGIEDGPKEIRIERMDEFGRVVSNHLHAILPTLTPGSPIYEV